MSNPGPASSTSIHPQNLGTNQALRVIACIKGLSVATLADTPIQVINSSYWVPTSVIVTNASVDVHSVYIGVYTAASQGGTAVLTAAALTSNTSSAYATVSAATSTSTTLTAQTLYVNVSTATASGTVDVYVYGYDLSGPQQ